MLSLKLLLVFSAAQSAQLHPRFLVEPYIQLGLKPISASRASLDLMWQSVVPTGKWQVQYRSRTRSRLVAIRPTVKSASDVGGAFFKATMADLKPGQDFTYQVFRNGTLLFQSSAKAPKAAGQDYSAVVFGDFGDDGREEADIARQAWRRQPDLAIIPGDIVYPKGRLHEFRERLFPVLNSVQAPLMRSVPVAASLGNHDVAASGEVQGLAYFYLFSGPRNGPEENYNTAPSVPRLAGPAFARMGSYSFEYGDSTWIALDSNPNINWADVRHRAWLEDKLRASHKRWKFVFFHHPPFHSSEHHKDQRWMSAIAPLFCKYKVDVVFSGHVHNYQRSRPILSSSGGQTIDRVFDGRTRIKPKGPIYLVTGGGGAALYDKRQETQPSTWEPYTVVFKAQHSFTCLRVAGAKLSFQQVNTKGEIIDSFTVRK